MASAGVITSVVGSKQIFITDIRDVRVILFATEFIDIARRFKCLLKLEVLFIVDM